MGSRMDSYGLAPKTKFKIFIIILSVSLYLLNRLFLKDFSEGLAHWFLVCYWNDITGAIAFSSCVTLIIYHYTRKEIHIGELILILLMCGLFWELVTPLFRKNSVCDFWDIVAYEVGGIVYHMSITLFEKLSTNAEV